MAFSRSYANQIHHRHLDRYAVRDYLLQLTQAEVMLINGRRSYQEQYDWLTQRIDPASSLESEFLDFLFHQNLRLPDFAQYCPESEVPSQPDFYYERDRIPGVCIFVDGPVHDKPRQAEHDTRAKEALQERGYRVIVVRYDRPFIDQILQNQDIFNVRFDVETILPLYNVNPLQTSALKTNDSQTKELPFLASLLFVQNKEPFKTKPQKERVISLRFKKEDISQETSTAFHKLTQIPIAELGNFFIEIMSQRHKIESEWYDEYVKAKEELYSKIPDNRLNENHALILAFHRLLSNIIDVNYDLKQYIEHIGQVKYNDCNKSNETIADYFFDLLLGNVINGDSENQCYKINEQDNKIYIHLGKAIKAIEKQGLPLRVQLKDLQQSLLEHPSFIESNKGNRQIGGIFQKTWIFDSQKIIGQV